MDEGISHFYFGMDRIGFCLSRRSRTRRRFPLLPSLSHQHIVSRNASVYRQFPTVLSVSDSGMHIHSSVGLRGSSLRHRLRSPRPPTFSDVQRVACRIGRRGIHRRSWLHLQRVILATPLKRTAPNLLPQRVRSACRAQRRGGLRRFFCLVFFALKSWSCEPRSIFPFAKVGLTAHRKTSRGFLQQKFKISTTKGVVFGR